MSERRYAYEHDIMIPMSSASHLDPSRTCVMRAVEKYLMLGSEAPTESSGRGARRVSLTVISSLHSPTQGMLAKCSRHSLSGILPSHLSALLMCMSFMNSKPAACTIQDIVLHRSPEISCLRAYLVGPLCATMISEGNQLCSDLFVSFDIA